MAQLNSLLADNLNDDLLVFHCISGLVYMGTCYVVAGPLDSPSVSTLLMIPLAP